MVGLGGRMLDREKVRGSDGCNYVLEACVECFKGSVVADWQRCVPSFSFKFDFMVDL